MNKAPALVAFIAFVACVAMGGAAFAAGAAAPAASSPLEQQALSFVQAQLGNNPALPGRVEVVAGPMDARLRLAPCQQVQAYLTPNTRLWGKTRVGLRCTQGATPWNIYLPVTVKVWGKALVMNQAMPGGQVLAAGDVRETEVDLAEEASPALTDASALVGRVLARSVSVGQGVRQATLKARQWFAPGDTVRIRAVGDGYAVAGSGEAVTAGIEGQPARVRTESGRLVTGVAVAEHQLELAL
ncbi:flagellar basal body P-ring formation chaperone FlgA [Rhizobacter sp. P5_C2]